MTLRIRSRDANGQPVWILPASGDLSYLRRSGWISIQKAQIKTDTGVWKDTGYIGLPGQPLSLGVVSVDHPYTNLRVAWEPPNTLIQPIRYNIELYNRDADQVVSDSEVRASVTTAIWGINRNTRYRVRVRCIGPNGAYGPWSDYLRWKIEEPGTPNHEWPVD